MRKLLPKRFFYLLDFQQKYNKITYRAIDTNRYLREIEFIRRYEFEILNDIF